MRLFNNGIRTRNQLGDISIPSSLAAEIDNKFKLRCLKVRYSPKARLVHAVELKVAHEVSP